MTTNKANLIVRRARLTDVSRMMPLLEEYARQAEILPRTAEDVYRSIREWVVVEGDGGRIVGMGSLLVMWHDLAEVRSLVIHPDYHGRGLGRQIVEMLLQEARALGLHRVFALTRKPAFFLKIGFDLTHIEHLPRKVKHDCVFCPKFHSCDEVAVITQFVPQSDINAPEETSMPEVYANGATPKPVIPLMPAS